MIHFKSHLSAKPVR